MENIEIRYLSSRAVTDLGMKLDVTNDWRDLAYYCFSMTHIETQEIEYNVNRLHKSPTSFVLEQWVKHNATASIRDLIGHLEVMKRRDVINVIQELWHDNLLGRVTPRTCPMMTIGSSYTSHRSHPGNCDLSSICGDESASPSEHPGAWHSPKNCKRVSCDHRPPLHTDPSDKITHNPHARSPVTNSTFLDKKVLDSSNPSQSFSTWPTKTPRNLGPAYTPRSWPESTYSSQEQQSQITSGNSHASDLKGYVYDGNGLRSHVPSYKGHVFITYSAGSSRYIQSIHNALQLEGYCVLTDVKCSVVQQAESKTTEEEFHCMLSKGVENCHYVLCLLCKDYMQELKGQDQSNKIMNIQFISKLMDDEFKKNGKQNKRFIPFCLSERLSVSSLPPYLMNCPIQIQEHFVTVINRSLGKQRSNLVIYRVENKNKKRFFKIFKKP